VPQGSLFLPFTTRGKAIELRAIEAKEKLGLGPYEVVDPEEILSRVPARLFDPGILSAVSPPLARRLFHDGVKEWSAIGLGRSTETGEYLILVNPTHHPRRQRASLMEEVIHIVLDHPKTALAFPVAGAGTWIRPFEAEVEDEAFAVGAACILPYRHLFRAVNDQHRSAAEIAEELRVSQDYVVFRIKRAGLLRVYNKHCA
jgi:hypothetical protein